MYSAITEGMLLLLKETFLQNRFFMDFNYLKNVDILMTYKKSCGNTIKFATQNISPALVQVCIHWLKLKLVILFS